MQSISRMMSPGQLGSVLVLASILGCSDAPPGSPRNPSTSGSGSGGSGAGTTGSGGNAGSTTTGSGGSGGSTTGSGASGGSSTGGVGGGTDAGATGGTAGTGGTGGTGTGGTGTGGAAGTTTGGAGAGGAGTGGSSGNGGTTSDGGPGGTGGSAGSPPPPLSDGGGSGGTGGMPPGDASAPDGGGSSLDPDITGIVTSVDSGRISTGITTLSNFTTRNTCSNNTSSGNTIGAARDWINGQFSTIGGLTVSNESFNFTGCGATMTSTVTDHNVIAVKLGTHPERVIVIGGHYDSRTIDPVSPTDRAPGANDAGSQTALVLEAARVMAGYTFDATLIFAAFAAEEQGLAGSAQLAKDYANYVTAGAKVEAMLNCDIVGGDTSANNAAALKQFRLFSPGTPREIVTPLGRTDDTSPSRGIMRYIGYWGARYVPSMTMLEQLREDRPTRGGDQQSFLDQGIAAVRFIETVESPNPGVAGSHQHTADDLPMYVSPDYTARITQLVVAVGASLARAPTAPRSATVTGTGSGPWTIGWMAPASGPAVDHYVIAARPSTENFYHTRVAVPASATSQSVTAAELGLSGSGTFYISVAAVDAVGHESLFTYPEYRCDTSSCVVPSDALNVTARN
ncbi:MAG TPA: M28 family peptidase [Polyangiaceae bacterium]|nr:M28 family peptidase [Polyangiaceae bacterium]